MYYVPLFHLSNTHHILVYYMQGENVYKKVRFVLNIYFGEKRFRQLNFVSFYAKFICIIYVNVIGLSIYHGNITENVQLYSRKQGNDNHKKLYDLNNLFCVSIGTCVRLVL